MTARNLGNEERRAWTFGALGIAAMAIVPFVNRGSGTVAALVLGGGAVAAVIFSFAAYRYRSAKRGIGMGCREVFAVGWTRAPDGVNYAVFDPDANPRETDPELVLRLPIRRSTRSGPALLCGPIEPSRRKTAALVTHDGEVLGVGRVRSEESGRKVWARRHKETPWYSAGDELYEPPDV